jgi:putative acetyltransferase
LVPAVNFEIRRAGFADAEEIAAAHLDSIRSIGARYYEPAIVREWGARVKADLYLNAMAHGEVFFVAQGPPDNVRVLGFSSHRIAEGEHRTAVYVRGQAARLGIGSALFRSAEAAAIDAGATGIHVAASLAAVEFYRTNGFEEIGRGDHRLSSGQSMACVFMRKNLSGHGENQPRRHGDTEPF